MTLMLSIPNAPRSLSGFLKGGAPGKAGPKTRSADLGFEIRGCSWQRFLVFGGTRKTKSRAFPATTAGSRRSVRGIQVRSQIHKTTRSGLRPEPH